MTRRSTLQTRVAEELAALFDLAAPARVAFAPSCIDVIGGLLCGAGGVHGAMSIDSGVQVIVQPRTDDQIVIFDFDEYDQKRPFTLQISADALMRADAADLKRNLEEPGRGWAAPVVGGILGLRDVGGCSGTHGFNMAILRDDASQENTLANSCAATRALARDALGADLVQSASARAATFAGSIDASPVQIAAILRQTGCAICTGRKQRPDSVVGVRLPAGVRVVGVAVEPFDPASVLQRMAVAAATAHRLIHERMMEFGRQAGRELVSDPMEGHIGNLALADYKRFFRSALPESMFGRDVPSGIAKDLDAETDYAPQLVADHLVIESHRAAEFVRHLAAASLETEPSRRRLALDKAGHLLYASHTSARENVRFGNSEADELIARVRKNESAGLYGARLCADGRSLAVLCDESTEADVALEQLKSMSGRAERRLMTTCGADTLCILPRIAEV